MDKKAPKLVENVKSVVGIKGPKISQLAHDVLKDLHKFKAPQSMLLTKRNITRPFEDVSSVEFLGKVNDASLFSYGSHSKKRPHNLVSQRTNSNTQTTMRRSARMHLSLRSSSVAHIYFLFALCLFLVCCVCFFV